MFSCLKTWTGEQEIIVLPCSCLKIIDRATRELCSTVLLSKKGQENSRDRRIIIYIPILQIVQISLLLLLCSRLKNMVKEFL